MKSTPAEAIFKAFIDMQVTLIEKRICEAVKDCIKVEVEAAVASVLARASEPPEHHESGEHAVIRSLRELMALPAAALVSPHEASLLTGLSVESMKSKRRSTRFPEAVRVGHRTIKWRMGDIRKFLKEAA